ncbi:hypothetical protein GCM10007937_31730 [Mesorhizobium albiziae]|nr:hypothetical protein GCM10007937_31730 [Mesorhizobium albiziae]
MGGVRISGRWSNGVAGERSCKTAIGQEAPYVAPLCPAGHLPHKGGDWPATFPSPTFNVAERAATPKLPISPLVGEMSGRTEGGNVERKT